MHACRNSILALSTFAIVSAATVVAAAIPLATNVSAAQQQPSGFHTISTEQLAASMIEKDFLLVNVHIPYEGEIERTDASIPFDEIEVSLEMLPADKDTPIVLYCRSGRMSQIAAAKLAGLGYTDVSHLDGGMIEWEADGYSLVGK